MAMNGLSKNAQAFHNSSAMKNYPPNNRQACSAGRTGFSLIELMIVIVIVGVLAAIAYPAFIDSIRKGRRAEAFAALTAVQQAQERWRANNSSYSSDLTSAPPSGLGQNASTPNSYYTISLANSGSATYEAIATAVSGSTQANDANCAKLGVRTLNGNLSYAGGAAADSLTYAPSQACWSR